MAPGAEAGFLPSCQPREVEAWTYQVIPEFRTGILTSKSQGKDKIVSGMFHTPLSGELLNPLSACVQTLPSDIKCTPLQGSSSFHRPRVSSQGCKRQALHRKPNFPPETGRCLSCPCTWLHSAEATSREWLATLRSALEQVLFTLCLCPLAFLSSRPLKDLFLKAALNQDPLESSCD